jgi:predicted DCC family thiol-disulfide oxidoreductase YuxK
VRAVLAADRAGAFRFAPIGGEAFQRSVAAERRASLPDSIVLRRADGALLVRSDAAVHILERLGGGWRVLGGLLRLVPRALRDAAYDALARRRLLWFERPKEACPIVPPELRKRFVP